MSSLALRGDCQLIIINASKSKKSTMKLIIAKDEVASWKIRNRSRTKRAGTKQVGRIGRKATKVGARKAFRQKNGKVTH